MKPPSIDPKSITHIILVFGHETYPPPDNLEEFVMRMYFSANTKMFRALVETRESDISSIDVHYTLCDRYHPSTGEFDPHHPITVADLLAVPPTYSLFVQLLKIPLRNKMEDGTLITAFESQSRKIFISVEPIEPFVT